MTNAKLLRWTGLALACGGALTFLLNAGLTPLLPRGGSFVETARSSVFLWRQSASALAAALLLFGSIGLYLRQAGRAGRFGAIAFVTAFLGSALVLATEWNQVFDVRDLAFRAPDTLRALEDGHGPHLTDIGALTSLAIFTLGWIALAASTLRVGLLSRKAATLVIAGFFAIPLLGAAGLWGAVAGNAILGSGWCWLGWEVFASSNLTKDDSVLSTQRL